METTQEERDELARSCDYWEIPGDGQCVVARMVRDANKCAAYERACVRRSEGAPEWAKEWHKTHRGSPIWVGEESPKHAAAPDLRPDVDGPVTLPIVDV